MRTWLALSAIGIALTACSSNGDSDATTTSAPATASTTTSTSTSTSTSSTSTTSTTVAPTTTIPLIDEIQTAMDNFLAGHLRCGEAPARCDVSFLAEGSPIQGRARDSFARRAGADQYYSTDHRGTYIRVEDITARTSTSVTAIACWYDPVVILGPPGPDGAPTIVDDRAISNRKEYTFVDDRGSWKVAEQVQLEDLGEGDQCDGA